MARTKWMPWTTQPEPNLFVEQTLTMSETHTHYITTSNPAAPEEPQPGREEESSQQPSTEMSETALPVVVIQPPPSGEETGEPTEAETDVLSCELCKKMKKEKKAKKDKQAK